MSVPVDLHDSGLLWLINRVVFHPRGFALGMSDGEFVLLGDGSEVWRFEDVDEDALFERVAATFSAAHPARNGPGVG